MAENKKIMKLKTVDAIIDYAKKINLPILEYQGEEYKQAYSDFYNSIMD